jgi:hypothetical protein
MVYKFRKPRGGGGLPSSVFAGLLACSQYASGRVCDWKSRHAFSWFYSVFKQMLR